MRRMLPLVALAAALISVLGAVPGTAQQTGGPVQPPIVAPDKVWPASAEQVDYAALRTLPDWRGIWLPMMGAGGKPEIPQLIGPYKSYYDKVQALIKSGDPEATLKVERRSSACEPPGMPGIMTQP